jgi:hypothetical protein
MEAVQVVLYVKKYSMGKEGTPPAPLMPVAFKQLGGYPPFPQTTSSTVRLGLWWKSGESSQQCPPSFKPAHICFPVYFSQRLRLLDPLCFADLNPEPYKKAGKRLVKHVSEPPDLLKNPKTPSTLQTLELLLSQ